jgi:hypothetical protein
MTMVQRAQQQGAAVEDNDDDGGQHNNQLTISHKGSNELSVECSAVNESPTRQPHWDAAASCSLYLKLSNMRKLVGVVTFVDKDFVHDDLGSRPNLLTNVERKLGEGFLNVHDELVDVLWPLLIMK